MNKQLLKSHMAKHGDTQSDLAEVVGLSLSRLNAKINESSGADFGLKEIYIIAERYKLSAADIKNIFFDKKVSILDTSIKKETG